VERKGKGRKKEKGKKGASALFLIGRGGKKKGKKREKALLCLFEMGLRGEGGGKGGGGKKKKKACPSSLLLISLALKREGKEKRGGMDT